MRVRALWWMNLILWLAALALRLAPCHAQAWDGTIVQHGKMHEAIGQRQHQGRVQLTKLAKRAHFFGVGALEKLEGEITIYDGSVTVTGVDSSGQLEPNDEMALDKQATILVGAYVGSWTDHTVPVDVGPDEFDQFIAEAASSAGIQTSQPFVFTVEGEFSDLKLHVINGACPMHAKRNRMDVPRERQPYEQELNNIGGTLVGVFAKDAVGNLTHPETSTHTHVLLKDATSGKTMTGHVERVTLTRGAVLRLPVVQTD